MQSGCHIELLFCARGGMVRRARLVLPWARVAPPEISYRANQALALVVERLARNRRLTLRRVHRAASNEARCAHDHARSLKTERRCIKELEQELRRKEEALVESATLLILAKQYRALPAVDEDV